MPSRTFTRRLVDQMIWANVVPVKIQSVPDQFCFFPIAGCLGCVCDTEIGDNPVQFMHGALGMWQVYKTQYWGRHNANYWTGSLPTFGRVSFLKIT